MALPLITGPYTELVPQVRALRDAVDASLIGGAIYNDTAYASLSEAVTAIGSAVSTLRISTSLFPNGATCTVPATLLIKWVGAGSLDMTTGQTVTIQSGDPDWPIRKLFYNALASQGTISFSGNNISKDYWVEWWGAVGDNSTDDTAALNAAFAAWPANGTNLHLSPRKNYRNTGVTIDHKAQGTVVGSESLSGQMDSGWAPKLIYNGTDGGTALTLNNVYAVTFRGFGIEGAASAGATGAAKGIYLTMTAGGSPGLTSNCTLQSMTIHPISTRATWTGIDIDNASGANNEQHQISNIRFFGSAAYPSQVGTGIYLGHANVKQIAIERCSFTWMAFGINSSNGSIRAKNNIWTENKVMYGGAYTDTIVIEGDDAESNTQVLNLASFGDNPLTLKGGRYGSLRGGQVVASGTTDDPVIQIGGGSANPHLIIDGNIFECVGSRFTDDFIQATGSSVVVYWGINRFVSTQGDPALIVMSFHDLVKGFKTFRAWTRLPVPGMSGGGPFDGLMIGGIGDLQTSLQGVQSSGNPRNIVGIIADDRAADFGQRVGSKDSISIGDSAEFEIAGLAKPTRPDSIVVGAVGPPWVQYKLAVIARDSGGNRTMPSLLNENAYGVTTLTGSNYLTIKWPRVPGAADYLLVEYNSGWRIVATVTPSGTDDESYNIVANPSGAFTYAIPSFNETSTINTRGRVIAITEITFTANDATPSVVQGNDFVTANSGATSITTFDNGVTGQLIRVRVNDANSTLVNGSGLLNRTGANISAVNGLIYSYIRRGSSWYEL